MLDADNEIAKKKLEMNSSHDIFYLDFRSRENVQ